MVGRESTLDEAPLSRTRGWALREEIRLNIRIAHLPRAGHGEATPTCELSSDLEGPRIHPQCATKRGGAERRRPLRCWSQQAHDVWPLRKWCPVQEQQGQPEIPVCHGDLPVQISERGGHRVSRDVGTTSTGWPDVGEEERTGPVLAGLMSLLRDVGAQRVRDGIRVWLGRHRHSGHRAASSTNGLSVADASRNSNTIVIRLAGVTHFPVTPCDTDRHSSPSSSA